MKENLTELVFILDRSGSMSNLTDDTIGGFNSLIDSQKSEAGEAYVTTVLFDDKYELLHDHVNLKDVQPLTRKEYFARGMTALLDAIGRTINTVGERLANTPEEERPSRVVIAITTDGFENSSREFTKKQIKDMIEHQQTKYSWVFMFLGANMDAVSEAESLGIRGNMARTYTNSSRGVETVYTAMSASMSVARAAKSSACLDALSNSISTALDEVE